MQLPVRKCYHAVKIGIFLVIVVTLLSCFERWRGGRRTARAQYLSPEEEEYERQILEDEARIIPGLGEGGVAAHLVGEAKRLGEESEKKLAINVYLSDRIAYNRTLKDYRNPACKRVLYDAELPSASVILIFHNEPYSVVVRTIWSVINSARRDQPWYSRANYIDRERGRTMTLGYPGQDPSSPFVYLKEIILVDDNSTLAELKGKLSHYIRTRLPPDLVRVVRLPDRQGLMRARMRGARVARGDVLIFLDAHCEGNTDWLRPLLQRIRHKRDAVLTPLIDVIDQTTFQLDAAEHFQVGGFTFTGHFTWVDVSEREKKRRGSDIAPTWSPTMAGGLFAMERAYFWQLGAYDEQMAGWGGENLEMSFRVWQCGGTLETIPCSRVGHVFRSFHPYGLPAHTDTHGINTARMAEVWMDDYAELFYLHRPDLRKSERIGDVTHRKVLRDKLQCKSFQWYLDTVYKEKFVPVRDVYGYGRFKNPSTGFCLDTMQREGEASPLGAYPCHATLAATQYLALSLAGELRDEERCADLHFTRRKLEEDEGRRVLMITCHGKQRGQRWRYLPSKQLKHVESGLCLTSPRDAGADVTATRCRPEPAQRWDIDYSEDNGFGLDNNVELTEQELKLQRLRGRRRISRSLTAEARRGHHKHRAKPRPRRKNKFLLQLVRDTNTSAQHVEAALYCRHRRLLPNDTFVRDIVTALNDRDIKVINNGRIFEKNKVTYLNKKHSRKEVKLIEKTDLPKESPVDRTDDVQPPKHKQKHKTASDLVQPYDPRSPISPAAGKSVSMAGNVVHVENIVANPGAEKKIIIEDFVAVKPAGETTVAPKRKRKRVKSRPPRTKVENSVLQPLSKQQWEVAKRSERQESSGIEDSPLLNSGESRKRNRIQTDDSTFEKGEVYRGRSASGGVSPLYTHEDAPQPRVLLHDSGDDDTERHARYPADSSRPPVKLVLRSNLTFRLGDEFFTWKHAADDVANLLGELSIPVSTAPPRDDSNRMEEAESLRNAEDTQSGAEDVILTGRGLSSENTSDKGTDASGSSESRDTDE